MEDAISVPCSTCIPREDREDAMNRCKWNSKAWQRCGSGKCLAKFRKEQNDQQIEKAINFTSVLDFSITLPLS